jgi:hypothetical protein
VNLISHFLRMILSPRIGISSRSIVVYSYAILSFHDHPFLLLIGHCYVWFLTHGFGRSWTGWVQSPTWASDSCLVLSSGRFDLVMFPHGLVGSGCMASCPLSSPTPSKHLYLPLCWCRVNTCRRSFLHRRGAAAAVEFIDGDLVECTRLKRACHN